MTVVIKRKTNSFSVRVVATLPPDTPAKLIKIKDREKQVDYCESCGGKMVTKFCLYGRMVCLGCFDGKNVAGKFENILPGASMSFNQFKERLEELVGLDLLNQLPQIKNWVVDRG